MVPLPAVSIESAVTIPGPAASSLQISYRFQRSPTRGDVIIFYPPEEVSKKMGFPPGECVS